MKQIHSIILVLALSASAHAKDVVVVGDSLSCGPFGKYLMQELARSGDTVTLFCAVSSAPSNWLKGKNPSHQQCKTATISSAKDTPKLELCDGSGQIPPLSSILNAHPGAKFVIAMGTNSLLSPKVDASYKKMAQAVNSGGGCEWIGPPHLNPPESRGFPSGRVATLEHNLNSFYDSLGSAVDSSCSLIDSRDATIAGTPGNETVDGVHRTDAAGKYWINHIAGALSHSANSSSGDATSSQ